MSKVCKSMVVVVFLSVLSGCGTTAGVLFGTVLAVPVVGMSVCVKPSDAAIGSLC